GNDRTAAFMQGARAALEAAKAAGAVGAVLKERSPSCGSGRIYDGTFSHVLADGEGVTAAALKEADFPVWGESEIDNL
ncbi:MAG: DUF523 domain-containing protein, partial [Clostridia bacterium]|nr:DUF523 domain-containing protein [Clostridia bacterium]